MGKKRDWSRYSQKSVLHKRCFRCEAMGAWIFVEEMEIHGLNSGNINIF